MHFPFVRWKQNFYSNTVIESSSTTMATSMNCWKPSTSASCKFYLGRTSRLSALKCLVALQLPKSVFRSSWPRIQQRQSACKISHLAMINAKETSEDTTKYIRESKMRVGQQSRTRTNHTNRKPFNIYYFCFHVRLRLDSGSEKKGLWKGRIFAKSSRYKWIYEFNMNTKIKNVN